MKEEECQYKDRQTGGRRDQKKRMSDCHVSAGREWKCAAAGHPHGW